MAYTQGRHSVYNIVNEPTGVLDSGAEGSTIPRKIARQLQCPINRDNSERTTYVYGNNQRLESVGTVKIGTYTVDVMPEPVATPLISVSQIVDSGFSVHFKPDNVSIAESNGEVLMTYKRGNNLSWKVPVSILSKLSMHKETTKGAYSGRLHTTAVTPRERVMEIHGRMVHASEVLEINS